MVNQVGTTDEFKTSIGSGKIVVVDFYATWCGPCKAIAPKVVEMSKEFSDVDFIKVDVDDLSDVAADYSIRAMPTFLIFKNGEQVGEVIGANAAKLKATIAEIVSA